MQRLTPKLRLKLRWKLELKLRLEPEARACNSPSGLLAEARRPEPGLGMPRDCRQGRAVLSRTSNCSACLPQPFGTAGEDVPPRRGLQLKRRLKLRLRLKLR